MQGCRGRSPRQNKLLISPFPPGRGAGGWGQERKLKAGRAGDKESKPPQQILERQRQPATSRASPPPGAWFATLLRCRSDSAPGDARGGAPCIRKLKISPFPGGEGGWGSILPLRGRGAENQTKGRVGGREKKQATPTDFGTARSASDLPGKHPNGHLHRRFSPCRLRLRRGDARGGAPCIRKLKISPFPGGEGGRGDILPLRGRGAGKKTKGRVGRQQTRQATPADSGTARSAGDLPGKHPNWHRQRPPSRRQGREATRRARGSLPCSAPPRAPPSPSSPIKTARNPRPQSGRGRSRPARSGSSGNADYISIPMFLFSASSSEQRQQRQRSAEPQRHLRR